MISHNLKQKIRYKFDNFMTRGGSSIFMSLLFIFLGLQLIIGIIRGIAYYLLPNEMSQNATDFLTNFFITFLQLTDPGNMAQDITSSFWFKIPAIIAGMAGVVMFSALIAFITNALDRKINSLKKGFSRVIESNHTVILGWDPQRILEILRELIIANESEKNPCVLILSDEDKETMDDYLSINLPDTQNTRVVTRSGNISSLVSMEIISINTCKSVIVLSSCDENAPAIEKSLSDSKVIKAVLAVVAFCSKNKKHSIVAEIFNPELITVVETIAPNEITVIDSNELLGKIIVQTSRSNGLSVVYTELFSFGGCEIYFYTAHWESIKFASLANHFKDGIPIGIRKPNGSILLNPQPNTNMQDKDELIIIAFDDSSIQFSQTPFYQPKKFEESIRKNTRRIEKELLIGWNSKAKTILEQYNDYLFDQSIIDIVVPELTHQIEEDIQILKNRLSHIIVSVYEKNVIHLETLQSINPSSYDNIIILCPNSKDAEQADAENISKLLLLRKTLSATKNQVTKLITEVSDSKNLELIAYTGVNDLIISNRLISMMLAQISENQKIYHLYSQLLKESGAEIYIKPIGLYFNTIPNPLTIMDLIHAAQKRHEICIGLKIKSLEKNGDQNYGIILNPQKSRLFSLNDDDALVVLAEDEA